MQRSKSTPSPIGRAIGEVFREERIQRNMNIQKFSQLIGMPRSGIHNSEDGLAPSANSLDKMLSQLGISWADFGARVERKRSSYVSDGSIKVDVSGNSPGNNLHDSKGHLP